MCTKLMQDVSKSLKHLGSSQRFWLGSQVVLRWIINPDLRLPRFVKPRVDRILSVASADAWKYANTLLNPADMGTRMESVRRSGSHSLWLNEPNFLLHRPGASAFSFHSHSA